MLVVLLVAAAAALVNVTLHLLALRGLSQQIPRIRHHPFVGLGLVIVVAIFAHLCEIMVFALALRTLMRTPELGHLVGADFVGLRDQFYYSAVTYASLGYGDLVPVGHLRLFASVEALTGIVLITWTASFTFLVMQRIWGSDGAQKGL